MTTATSADDQRRSWLEQAHGRARAGAVPARRGPGYSRDPHADGNERADDRIVVVGPDEEVVRRGAEVR